VKLIASVSAPTAKRDSVPSGPETAASSEDGLSHVLKASPFLDVDLNHFAPYFNDLNN
jgi:hypothetical protein